MHGRNDEHAAAVGRWLVARDGFDFLLYYLPEVDMAQHRVGPDAALDAVERADEAVERPGRRPRAGWSGSSSATRSSSAPTTASRRCARRSSCARRSRDLPQFVSSLRSTPADSAIAVAASNRAAMVYRLTDAPPARELAARVEELAADRRRRLPRGRVGRRAARRAWRCASGATRRATRTARGGRWRAGRRAGRPRAGAGGRASCASATYPNALERVDQILHCVNAGEVVISAAPGVEFTDAGGSHHLGGGSHGALGAEESLVPLVTVGLDGVSLPDEPSITDVYGLVARHFGL